MSLMVGHAPDFPFPAPDSSICVQPMNAVKRGEREMSQPIAATTATKTVAEFLIEKYPAKTAEHVAADTGCTAPTVKRWLYGGSLPSFECFAKLILAYGPDFLMAVLPPTNWITKAARETEEAKLLEQHQALQKRINEFYATR